MSINTYWLLINGDENLITLISRFEKYLKLQSIKEISNEKWKIQLLTMSVFEKILDIYTKNIIALDIYHGQGIALDDEEVKGYLVIQGFDKYKSLCAEYKQYIDIKHHVILKNEVWKIHIIDFKNTPISEISRKFTDGGIEIFVRSIGQLIKSAYKSTKVIFCSRPDILLKARAIICSCDGVSIIENSRYINQKFNTDKYFILFRCEYCNKDIYQDTERYLL